jgi:hypothetical protein
VEEVAFGDRTFDLERRTMSREPSPCDDKPRCSLVRTARATRLRLSGCLPTGWAGSLATGVAQAELSILRGFAERLAEGRWVADFELAPTTSPVVDSLDFLALATTRPADASPSAIGLDRFYIDGSPDSGGSLFLEVRGQDRVGFLAGLLERLAFVSLFPEEMTIETRGRQVVDTFLLRGPAGQSPADSAQRALAEVLKDLVEP